MSRIVNWLLGYDLDAYQRSFEDQWERRRTSDIKRFENIENVLYKIPYVRENMFCNDCGNIEEYDSYEKALWMCYRPCKIYMCLGMKELSKDNPLKLPMRHDKCSGYKKPAKKKA